MIVYKKRVKVSKKKRHTLTLSSMNRKRRERKLDMKGEKKILIRSVTEQQKSCCNSTNIGMRLILEYGIELLQGPRLSWPISLK